MQNFAILASDESDSVREASVVEDPVGLGDRGVRIAEDWIVEFQRLGEVSVFLDGVAACCEVSNVELTQGLTARTERFAFGRSATGKGFGVPRNNEGLSLK